MAKLKNKKQREQQMNITPKNIEAYCIQVSNRPSEVCDALEEHTRENVPMSQMLVGKLEASLLSFLIRLNKAKRVLEFGTYTGYSALAMAENLPEDGEVVTLDINPETVDLAKSYWDKSTHGKKIKSILGPASESLQQLKGPFDLVFIDADKTGYMNYLKGSLPMLSDKGVIVLDNALWSGNVLEGDHEVSKDTEALREVNNWVASQKNLFSTLLPVRDGMFLIQKS